MPDDAASKALQRPTELRVSGHLMTLEAGVYCIVNQAVPGAAAAAADGLPGVRISVPPGADAHNPRVTVRGFREDGWLSGGGDAALVRVWSAMAQILVTIYQGNDPAVPAPNLQVIRLSEFAAVEPAPPPPPPVLAAPAPALARPAQAPAGGAREVAAHVQRRGDVFVALGEWMGDRKSQRWIEGFAIAPQNGIALEDLEYQAVLGRGWLSPWVEGGQFCGSRGMALPILGLRVRLREAAAEAFAVELSATFVDGSEVGPVGNGEACEADSLAPLEAFQLILRPLGRAARVMPATAAAAPPKPATSGRKATAKAPAKAAPAKPTATKPAGTSKSSARPAPRPAPKGRRR